METILKPLASGGRRPTANMGWTPAPALWEARVVDLPLFEIYASTPVLPIHVRAYTHGVVFLVPQVFFIFYFWKSPVSSCRRNPPQRLQYFLDTFSVEKYEVNNTPPQFIGIRLLCANFRQAVHCSLMQHKFVLAQSPEWSRLWQSENSNIMTSIKLAVTHKMIIHFQC